MLDHVLFVTPESITFEQFKVLVDQLFQHLSKQAGLVHEEWDDFVAACKRIEKKDPMLAGVILALSWVLDMLDHVEGGDEDD